MHPLYYHSRQYIGHRVYVYAYGQIHHGILHQVTNEGVYLRTLDVVEAGGETAPAPAAHASLQTPNEAGVLHVFAPLLFLPFLAVGALGPWYWW